jgi:hypothetical protein
MNPSKESQALHLINSALKFAMDKGFPIKFGTSETILGNTGEVEKIDFFHKDIGQITIEKKHVTVKSF